jgi:hypothetical protein
MNKEHLATLIFEKLDDYVECKELAQEIVDELTNDLDEKIEELDKIMSDSRILKETYFTCKGKKLAYQELKELLD